MRQLRLAIFAMMGIVAIMAVAIGFTMQQGMGPDSLLPPSTSIVEVTPTTEAKNIPAIVDVPTIANTPTTAPIFAREIIQISKGVIDDREEDVSVTLVVTNTDTGPRRISIQADFFSDPQEQLSEDWAQRHIVTVGFFDVDLEAGEARQVTVNARYNDYKLYPAQSVDYLIFDIP